MFKTYSENFQNSCLGIPALVKAKSVPFDTCLNNVGKPDFSLANNFVDTNWSSINTLFETTGNEVAGYHNKTDSPSNTQRCKNVLFH